MQNLIEPTRAIKSENSCRMLFIAHRPPFPPIKGEKIRSFQQLKCFKEMGYKLTVCAPLNTSEDTHNMLELRDTLDVEIILAKTHPKAIRYATGVFKGKPISVSNFYSRSLQKKINLQLNTGKYDIVFCSSSSTAEYIFNADYSFDKNGPNLIMDFIDLDSAKWLEYSKKSSSLRSRIYKREYDLLKIYEYKIARTFNTSIFITDDERRLFFEQIENKLTDSKLSVVGNGVDLSNFEWQAKSPVNNRIELLFVGVMDYFPNIEAVMWFSNSIWPLLLERYPTAKLSIVGMNPVNKIVSLNGNNNISVTGYVDDVVPYFHKSTIFIAPFLTARGIQNKILQSLACGLPVVTTSIGAEGIRCKHEIDILVSDGFKSYLESICRLLEDRDLYKRLSINGNRLVHRDHTLQGVSKQLQSIVSFDPNDKL